MAYHSSVFFFSGPLAYFRVDGNNNPLSEVARSLPYAGREKKQ